MLPGSDVNLTCVAVGSPMPMVKWLQGYVELTPDDMIKEGRNMLTLKNVEQSLNYTCVAQSIHGEIQKTVEVRVKG